jgi:hypothetical protein
MLAGLYWVLKSTTGWDLVDHPFLVGRLMVAFANGIALSIYWFPLRSMILHVEASAWNRIIVAIAATWGTFLTSFAITINNHLPAAAATMLVMWCLWRIDIGSGFNSILAATAGLASGFAVEGEFPALSWLVLAGLYLTLRPRAERFPQEAAVPGGGDHFAIDPRRAYARFRDNARLWVPFAAGALLVLLVARVTNWIAHGSWLPPYAHRTAGADWQTGNWYVYPDSYWLPENRKGVDLGEPSIAKYAFHVLAGHHGWFSLTPIWCLSLVGIGYTLARPFPKARPLDEESIDQLVVMGFVVWLVCLLFYVFRPPGDRNYGGVSVSFRWLLWLVPFWLTAMLSALQRLPSGNFTRLTTILLLLGSIASASYGWFRPWQHPWLFWLLET